MVLPLHTLYAHLRFRTLPLYHIYIYIYNNYVFLQSNITAEFPFLYYIIILYRYAHARVPIGGEKILNSESIGIYNIILCFTTVRYI
jgi:hypothetical protein